MKLTVFASGSTGNCALVQGGGRSVLIDAGISARRIRTALVEGAVDPRCLDGIFITHEHADHISGLPVFTKQCAVPIFAPATVAAALLQLHPGLGDSVKVISPERPLSLGSMTVTSFPTMHDTPQSVGYRLEADGAALAVATDTGCVTDAMLEYLTGADAVLIEANHDVRMLQNGPYPAYLKRRILSDRGHLSNVDCARMAETLARQGTRRIILGHLSRHNNLPDLARRTVCQCLEGTGAELFVAPEFGRLEVEVSACFA